MCVKFPFGNLNHGLYPLYPTSTYTYGVTTTLRVHGGTWRQEELKKIKDGHVHVEEQIGRTNVEYAIMLVKFIHK